MSKRYRIVFHVADTETGQKVVNDRVINFEHDDADNEHVYAHLTGALLIMAKIIKIALGLEAAEIVNGDKSAE